jgi:tetratricopeptide (TPR) repeat protein
MTQYGANTIHHGAILRHCFEINCLYFPVLWKGDKPLGAIANLLDTRQQSMLFYIQGRDTHFKELPAGLILHADAIRYAIRNDFKVYDFLRGDEEYKYSFGAQDRRIIHIEVSNKNRQQTNLDASTIPLVFNYTVKLHRSKQLTRAEQGYLQILEVQPNHPEALFGLGTLMQQRGEYPAAENLWRTLLESHPNSLKTLFSLGNLYQAQNQLPQAIAAYRQILAIKPDAIAAHNNLGYALQKQGQWEEAIHSYQRALDLNPDCIEAEVNQANLFYAQGKLSPKKQSHYAALNNDLGCKCHQAGDCQTAAAYFRQALAMGPDQAQVHYNLGLVLQSQGDVEAALSSYRQALALQPGFQAAEQQLNQLSLGNSYAMPHASRHNGSRSDLDNIKLFEDAIPNPEFAELIEIFPENHFKRLKREGLLFYQTTFWYPLNREEGNIFEQVIRSLQPLVNPASSVIGVEWWFSVTMINKTPQWLLPYHFDRNDLAEKDVSKVKHPDFSSVLFLNAVPYGELVITDQILTERGIKPAQPTNMRFIHPQENLYAIFPGNLYHGVLGRMWRPAEPSKLRLAMAVNWWTEKPKAQYMRDSRDCMSVFNLYPVARSRTQSRGIG